MESVVVEMELVVVEMELVVVEVELAVVEMELEYEKPKKLAMFAQKVAASDAEFLIMDNAPLPQRGAKN